MSSNIKTEDQALRQAAIALAKRDGNAIGFIKEAVTAWPGNDHAALLLALDEMENAAFDLYEFEEE